MSCATTSSHYQTDEKKPSLLPSLPSIIIDDDFQEEEPLSSPIESPATSDNSSTTTAVPKSRSQKLMLLGKQQKHLIPFVNPLPEEEVTISLRLSSLGECLQPEKTEHDHTYNYDDDHSQYNDVDEDATEYYGLRTSDDLIEAPEDNFISSKPRILDETQARALIESEVAKLHDLFGISHANSEALLRHVKWRPNLLYEADMSEWKVKAGLSLKHSSLNPNQVINAPRGVKQMECVLCAEEDIPVKRMFALECEHWFCKECWALHLHSRALDGRAIDPTCPAPKCNMIVNEDHFKYLASDEDYQIYRSYSLSSFVMNNSCTVWCPTPDCGKIIYSEDVSMMQLGVPMVCSCGYKFCFSCCKKQLASTPEPHYPASCQIISLWLSKIGEESKYFIVRRKPCPQCSTPIIKCGCEAKIVCNDLDFCPNQACNHMICRVCSNHFCWMCGGDWGGHTDYYQCNKEVSKALSDRDKFVTCLQRYNNHNGGQKAAQLKLQKLIEDSKKDANLNKRYLQEAYVELIECCSTLKNSYVMNYFSGEQNSLFECHQGNLEYYTDRLQEKIERPNTNSSSKLTDEEQVRSFTRVIHKWRMKLYEESY